MEFILNEKCRLCLEETSEKYNLFELEDICRQIVVCTGVVMYVGDGGPTKICNGCLAELSISYSFRKKCNISDQKIKQILKRFADNVGCNAGLEYLSSKKEVKNERHSTNNHFLNDPNKLSDDENPLSESLLESDDHDLFQIKDVNGTESNLASFPRLRKRTKKHEFKAVESHFSSNSLLGGSFLSNNSKRKYRKHSKEKYSNKFGSCKKRGRKISSVDQDIAYQCDICGKHFTKKMLLDQHMRTHFVIMQFACELCPKVYSTKGNLKVHIMSHTDEKPFHCEICPKKFAKKRNLFVHNLRHMKVKNHACELCKMLFYTSGEVKIHMRKHTGEKPFTCSLCGKSFTAKNNLVTHITSHTGEKPFSCDICKKQFRSKNVLTNHTRLHTGEKPFVCSVCGKRFAVNKLAVHMRMHTGEKPHSCSICGRKFITSTALHIHKRLHSGEKPYECHLCHRVFGHTQSRNKHIRRKHNNDKDINRDSEIHQENSPESPSAADSNVTDKSYPITVELEV